MAGSAAMLYPSPRPSAAPVESSVARQGVGVYLKKVAGGGLTLSSPRLAYYKSMPWRALPINMASGMYAARGVAGAGVVVAHAGPRRYRDVSSSTRHRLQARPKRKALLKRNVSISAWLWRLVGC